jgi:hypothetical protein
MVGKTELGVGVGRRTDKGAFGVRFSARFGSSCVFVLLCVFLGLPWGSVTILAWSSED